MKREEFESLLDVINLTRELVQRPSITPLDENCQVLIKQMLEEVGFTCQFINRGGVTNLWATHSNHQHPINPELLAEPVVCLAGHIDVVPVGDPDKWTYPPFSATVAADPITGEEYIWGRGAEDMKGGIAGIVTAAIKYVQKYPDHLGTISILTTSDEEAIAVDGTLAVVQYLQEKGQKIHYTIVAEPSSKAFIGDTITIGRRGSLTCRATIIGKQGHVAYPNDVVNPIHQLGNIIQLLSSYQYDQGNEDFPASSIQFVDLKAGVGADNVVPRYASFVFNIRYNNCYSEDSIKAKLIELMDSFGYTLEVSWSSPGLPFITPKGKLVDVAKQSIKDILGTDATGYTGGGTSDARFIINLGGEVIELGVSSKTLHQVNERASISEIRAMEKIYLDIITKLFS